MVCRVCHSIWTISDHVGGSFGVVSAENVLHFVPKKKKSEEKNPRLAIDLVSRSPRSMVTCRRCFKFQFVFNLKISPKKSELKNCRPHKWRGPSPKDLPQPREKEPTYYRNNIPVPRVIPPRYFYFFRELSLRRSISKFFQNQNQLCSPPTSNFYSLTKKTSQ